MPSSIGKIPDAEFTDLELDDVDDNEIARQAAQNLPIILPWGRKPIPLGTSYKSSLQSSKDQSPWCENTPFILSDLYMMPKVLHRQRGTDATYKSISTTRECETGDHLSLGFGVGAGLPFLASVSIKGTYDKEVQENKDSTKTSIRSSVRAASVELERAPRLTTESTIVIKYGGGYEAFCERYGDYYLAGYRIGGETGLLISSSGFRSKKVDQYSVKATAKILIVSIEEEWHKDFYDFTSGKSLKLIGYDTVDGFNWNKATEGDGAEAVRSNALEIVGRSQNILNRVEGTMDALGLSDGMDLTPLQCDELVRAGVVVELVLLPMATIRDVARWRCEKNII